RKECSVVQAGDVRFLDAASDKVIAYERTLEGAASGPRRLVVACNFSSADAAALPADALDGGSVLIENCDDHRIQDGTLVLGPWCAVALAW
ncbi:MAG: alpha-glucosidase C-terminal domain-containing protein, partial [Parafannyhessea umbonata]|nr:alpha-glucosidase C-terminal domain-containing protein [Parafannyhessea umbonata]